MFIISGTFKLAPESQAKCVEIAAVMAKASQAEDGCHAYSFYTDVEDENTLRIFEIWESDEALAAHFKSAHMRTFQGEMAGLKILGRDLTRYEISSSEKM